MRSERWREKRHLLCHSTLARGNKFRNFHFCRDVSWCTTESNGSHLDVRALANTEQKPKTTVHSWQRKANVIVSDTVDSPVDTRRRHASTTRRLLLGYCQGVAASHIETQMCRKCVSDKINEPRTAMQQRIQLNGRCSGAQFIQFSQNEPISDRRSDSLSSF